MVVKINKSNIPPSPPATVAVNQEKGLNKFKQKVPSTDFENMTTHMSITILQVNLGYVCLTEIITF